MSGERWSPDGTAGAVAADVPVPAFSISDDLRSFGQVVDRIFSAGLLLRQATSVAAGAVGIAVDAALCELDGALTDLRGALASGGARCQPRH